MKKIYGLIGLGMFVFMLAFSLVSADISVSGIPAKLSQKGGSFNLNLTNNNNTANETGVNVSIPNLEQDNIWFNLNNTNSSITVDIENGSSIIINVTYGHTSGFDFELGQIYKQDLYVKGIDKGDLTFEETSFCSVLGENREEKNDLLRKFSLDVLKGYGDDNEWYPGDEIEVEFEIYRPNYDIENLDVEWELYNENGEPLSDGDFSLKDIDEGDKETVIFNFVFDENIEDYENHKNAMLYVRLIGEMDDGDYTEFCSWDKKPVKVQIEKNFVIVDNVKIDNEKVKFDDYNLLECDSEYSVSFDLWNIGYKDQNDVYVEVYSDKLDIYETFEIPEISEFDHSRVFDFSFEVPEDLGDGLYYLNFKVYDEDGDVYENSDDDESKLTVIFKNEESCLVIEPTVTANLSSEAIEGEEMIVKINIRNNDVKSGTFLVDPEGYQEWATLKGVSPEAVILDSGASEEITLTLKIKDDIEGEQEFELNIFSEDKLISTQPVQVSVEAKEFLQGFFNDVDWKVLGIILLNVILLIAIIIVARKILKRK